MANISSLSSLKSVNASFNKDKYGRIDCKLEKIEKEIDVIKVDNQNYSNARKDLDSVNKQIAKMRVPYISGRTIALSNDPFEKFSELVDQTNKFIEFAAETQQSLRNTSVLVKDRYNYLSTNYELTLDPSVAKETGTNYNYNAKEIVIPDEAKTNEMVSKRANQYSVHDFLKSATVNFNFLDRVDANDVINNFKNPQYNSLNDDQKAKFTEFLKGFGLQFDDEGGNDDNGKIVKIADNSNISNDDLDQIKIGINASIQLFDVKIPEISVKLAEIQRITTDASETLVRNIDSNFEEDKKTLTEKEKKVFQYYKNKKDIEEKESRTAAIWEAFDEEMEQLDKFFENLFKYLVGNDN